MERCFFRDFRIADISADALVAIDFLTFYLSITYIYGRNPFSVKGTYARVRFAYISAYVYAYVYAQLFVAICFIRGLFDAP